MKMLSHDQQIRIICTAKEAYYHQLEHSYITARADIARTTREKQWRYEETRKVAGVDSLSGCVNEHFEHLMGHFLNLAGREDEAFDMMMRAGPLPGAAAPAGESIRAKTKGEIPDTLENRNTWRWKLKQLSEQLKKAFPNYALGILKRQNANPKTTIEEYPANALRKAFLSLNYSAQKASKPAKPAKPKGKKPDQGSIDCPF